MDQRFLNNTRRGRCSWLSGPLTTQEIEAYIKLWAKRVQNQCCANVNPWYITNTRSNESHTGIFPPCIPSKLPFTGLKELNSSVEDLNASFESLLDPYLDTINSRVKQFSFIHINSQAMTLTFQGLLLVIRTRGFDLVTLSETWMKDNHQLLSHASITGYVDEFWNRDQIKGGGVGAYIEQSVKYKRCEAIETWCPEMEQLWLEIQGQNKYSNLLIVTTYRSDRILSAQEWFAWMENLLSELTTS